MEDNVPYTETIIIGAGQAGLSVARFLKENSHPFIILEKNSEIGSSWKERYDSLVLDSFAKYSQLEDFPFSGDPMRHARRDEVVDYLKAFAKKYYIFPQFSTEVYKIEKIVDTFTVQTSKGIYRSKNVVLATGPFHEPHIPEISAGIQKDIFQIHSKDYKHPGMLMPGRTLIVGGGNSGVEIAEELLEKRREVLFSFRGRLKSIKSSAFSQWLAYTAGLAHVPKDTLLGRIIIWYTKGKPVGVDVNALLKHPRLTPVGPFDISMTKEVSNIIWATGYKSDFSIINIPEFDPGLQRRGITNIPGLFVLNIRWQHSKSSSHLAGVSRDAKYIAGYIVKRSK